MTSKGKRKLDNSVFRKDDPDLIQEAEKDSGAESDDSTDSEESEYSGLEESDTESDSSVMSIQEEGESGSGEGSVSEDDDDEDDDDDDDGGDKSTSVTVSEGVAKSGNDANKPGSSTGKMEGPLTKRTPHRREQKTSGPSTLSTEGSETLKPNEYEQDSSDEEDIRNTVGNIPMEWYRDYDHLGYDLVGQKIRKPKTGDELDTFIKKMDDPNYWRSVKDKSTGQDVIISDKDVEVIQRLRKGNYVDANYNPYEPWVDFFTQEKMIHPLSNRPADKRSFIPSRLEALKVGKLVHAIKMGWLKPKQPKPEDDQPNYYMLWKDDDQTDWSKRLRHHIPAPKMPLPGHAESYNPPAEYLFTEEEEMTWKDKEPEERRQNFIPQKYDSLRRVPAYKDFIKERFERCLDLYLCPRQRKMRMNVDPEDLIPKLPKPKDLQPFPTTQSIVYRGHTALVRCICVDPTGQWLVSGSDDETVKLWEISTGRCMKTYSMGGTVRDVAWNPNTGLSLIAVAMDNTAVILNPELGDKLICSSTDNILGSFEPQDTENKTQIEWQECEGKEKKTGFRLKVVHPKNISQVTWHARGDYLATLMPQGQNKSVCIHQLSKRRSQHPFSKSKGLVQCVLFHPVRPFLFVATQRYVRVYNLLKQELTKKLMTNVKWVSSMAVHPGGDNVIVGSYDSKLSWFDLDLSTKPYQTLRHHKKALRQVCFHRRYPLFASASDDGTVIVCHGMVYSDLLQNPLIVPVKILRGHEPTKDLGVLDCVFHPTQPWLFSSGSDSTIRLYT